MFYFGHPRVKFMFFFVRIFNDVAKVKRDTRHSNSIFSKFLSSTQENLKNLGKEYCVSETTAFENEVVPVSQSLSFQGDLLLTHQKVPISKIGNCHINHPKTVLKSSAWNFKMTWEIHFAMIVAIIILTSVYCECAGNTLHRDSYLYAYGGL